MPSRKFSYRASMTNRPTGGGPKLAGLAPHATNFMMGVKRNHKFDAHPVKHVEHEEHTHEHEPEPEPEPEPQD